MAGNYRDKFRKIAPETLFTTLDQEWQERIENLAESGRLTFQELRALSVAIRDLGMWDSLPSETWWGRLPEGKKGYDFVLQLHETNKNGPRNFPPGGGPHDVTRPLEIVREQSSGSIHGMCPVASSDTVCCRLRTIDAVRGCPFSCSYCSIQTFYGDRVVFDADFREKLAAVPIDPHRFYRFGSGQASDSLVWGNRYGVLDDLLDFARDHDNILLELKTKSDKVENLLGRDVPRNVVCTWSLNPPRVIRAEEHGTPNLRARVSAARALADRGLKIGFHFHPIMHYVEWKEEYEQLAAIILNEFLAEEVLFLSFGTVTLIKPVIRAIRERGGPTRILQMPTSLDPKGKITYPDDLKADLLSLMVGAFDPWADKVYRYLCMEKSDIWRRVMGFSYRSNDEFEQDFGRKTMSRLK